MSRELLRRAAAAMRAPDPSRSLNLEAYDFALAKWLDDLATTGEHDAHALAIARAYLGEGA